jgi:hypothetical protein
MQRLGVEASANHLEAGTRKWEWDERNIGAKPCAFRNERCYIIAFVVNLDINKFS